MATIIKHDAPPQVTGAQTRPQSFDLSDMSHQADEYLEEVRREATKIIQQAKEEAVKIKRSAEEAGRKTAQDAIEAILDEKIAKQMRSLTPALAKAASQIEDSRQDWLRYWESSVLGLACEIAARIIRREIAQQPELPLEWISETLQLCAGTGAITVKLHPDDFEILGGQVQRLAESFHAAGETTLVADASLSTGGCCVETKFGSIDSQLETQLQRIQEELS